MRKENKKSGGLFAEKEIISRKELRETLKKDSGIIPGVIGEKYRRQERVNLAEIIFPRKKYGSEIKKWQAEKALRTLQSRRFEAETEEKSQELEKKLRYLKKVAGL